MQTPKGLLQTIPPRTRYLHARHKMQFDHLGAVQYSLRHPRLRQPQCPRTC